MIKPTIGRELDKLNEGRKPISSVASEGVYIVALEEFRELNSEAGNHVTSNVAYNTHVMNIVFITHITHH